MTQIIIRHPAELFTTEKRRVEAIGSGNDGAIFLLDRQNFLNIYPLHAEAASAKSLALIGSEIGGHGECKDLQLEAKCGFVVTSTLAKEADDDQILPISYSSPSTVVCALLKKDGRRTIGGFDRVKESSAFFENESSISSESVNPAPNDDRTYNYKLRRRFKLPSKMTLTGMCAVAVSPKEISSQFLGVLLSATTTDGDLLNLSVLSTIDLELQATIDIPLNSIEISNPDTSWSLIHLKSPWSENSLSHFAIWNSNEASTTHDICLVSHSKDPIQFLSYTWHKFANPNTNLPSLIEIVSPVSNAAAYYNDDSPFVEKSNMLLIWKSGSYQFFGFNDTHPLLLREYMTNSNVFILSLSHSAILEATWDDKQESLQLAVRHPIDGELYAVNGNGPQLNSKLIIDLPDKPSDIISVKNQNDALIYIIVGKQIYRVNLQQIHSFKSSTFLKIEDRSYAPINTSLLPSVGYNNKIHKSALDILTSTDILNNEFVTENLESAFCDFIEDGFVQASKEMTEKLIIAKCDNAILSIIRSCLTPEQVLVYLLIKDPSNYLPSIIKYMIAGKHELVEAIKKDFDQKTLSIVLSILSDWCEILCVLPTSIIDKEISELPPLHKIVQFISILMDAKLKELTSTKNETIMESLQSMAKSVASNLVVKRGLQKIQGQLASLISMQSCDVQAAINSENLIEPVTFDL